MGDDKYLKREFLGKQKFFIVSVTKRCNLCCLYCRGGKKWYDGLGQNCKSVDLKKEKWNELLKKIEGSAEIMLSGGEPAEYPLIKEFCLFLKENNVRFSFHTNGMSKNWDDIFTFFKENDLKPDIHISTELWEDLQKEIRGSKLPIEFIKRAKSLGMKVEIKVTLHQKTLPYLEDLENNLKGWLKIGVDSMFFQPVASMGEDFPEGLEINKDFIPFLEKLRDLKADSKEFKDVIRRSANGFDIIISLLNNGDKYLEAADKCKMCEQLFFLDADLKELNCKTLWNRDKSVRCRDFFDLVCAGFQS